MPPKVERVPPQCGADIAKPFLYNPYQQELLKARRLRICPRCYALGAVGPFGVHKCVECGNVEHNQAIAKKAYGRVGIVGGRRSGKTRVGGEAAREEITVPRGLGWVCGPSFKILHDSTMPTFFKLIPRSWVLDWSAGNMELTLRNQHVVQFRSLDDPERGRGQGPTWSWFDEAQKMKEKAWDVFRPSLTENSGNTIFTFTPNGFDWTWRRLWRPSQPTDTKFMPGFWMAKCRTLDNPWIQRFALDEIEEARKTMPPPMFRQEYEADFVSFVGNVYDWDDVEPLILQEDGLKYFLPEWPLIDKGREIVIGLNSEPGHPTGAVMAVVTERGVIVVREYYDEHRSIAKHIDNITRDLLTEKDWQGKPLFTHSNVRWTHDEEFQYVIQEAARKQQGIIGTEHYLVDGIQRVQSWLYAKQLWIAHTCERTLDQMQGYRWADNDSEEIRSADRVFEKDNELPNALRSALLSWPSLLEPAEPPTGRDLSALPDKVRDEIERLALYEKEQDGGDSDLDFGADGWPFGDMFPTVQHD